MGWLLALLGGPEGAVLMLLKRGWSHVTAAWAWIFASNFHWALTVALLLGGTTWYEHRAATRAQLALTAERDARHADGLVWQQVDQINHTSINVLLASLTRWSAMTRTWASTATARQDAARAALAKALERARALDADRTGISEEHATGCHTGHAVLDAKGEL
jgi:hypothetical protein